MCTMFLAYLQAKYRYRFQLLYAFTMGIGWVGAMLTPRVTGCAAVCAIRVDPLVIYRDHEY